MLLCHCEERNEFERRGNPRKILLDCFIETKVSSRNDVKALTFFIKSTIIPHMLKFVKDTIDMLNRELSAKFDDFKGLYLYGSFANGTNSDDDDIEIVAIFDVEDKAKRELIWPIVGKIETDLDVFIDLHPITMEELKKDEDFYDEVVNNGIFFGGK